MIALNTPRSGTRTPTTRSATHRASYFFTEWRALNRNSGVHFLQRFQRLGQAGLVPYIQAGFGAVDLAHQAAENLSRTDFDKRINPFRDQQSHALFPLHRPSHLADQSTEGAVVIADHLRIHVAGYRIHRL